MTTVVHIVGWPVIAAVVSWRLAWRRARTMINEITVRAHMESRRLRAEAVRWRDYAARLSQEIEAWKAGHLEGRADVASIVPLLVAAQQDSAACACTALSQVPGDS